MSKFIKNLKKWARQIKLDVCAVWFAARDPATPLIAKILSLIVAAYAISPIDLIPDFIPVLGYLDDLILVPLGIMLVLKLIPLDVMERCRDKAEKLNAKPRSNITAAVFIVIWLFAAYWMYLYIYPKFK